jgi:uncharacterized membrane protein YccC
MERCLICNTLLARDERECIDCGTRVHAAGLKMANLLLGLIALLFYGSVVELIVSPFVVNGPSVILCLLTSCTLWFVLRRAREVDKES